MSQRKANNVTQQIKSQCDLYIQKNIPRAVANETTCKWLIY